MDQGKNNNLEHIFSTSAFKSLNAEVQLAKFIYSLGWRTTQGAYYQDLITRKFREIDIVADSYWTHKESDDIRARLRFVVEVKSASDFNIIFSNNIGNEDRLKLLDDFIGYDYSGYRNEEIGNIKCRQERIINLLREKGVDKVMIDKIFKKLNKAIFPKSRSVFFDVLDDAAPIEYMSCSFREFLGKNEKELDNSVLWRASQALTSAAAAINESNFLDSLSDLEGVVDLAIKKGYSMLDIVLNHLIRDAKGLHLLHPVVVTDSKLWMTGDGKIDSLKWCRFVQKNFKGHASWWVDVVNYDNCHEYFDKISNYYINEMSLRMKMS